MSELLGYAFTFGVAATEEAFDVLTICGAAFANVYGDVEDVTFDTTDKFALGVWGALEMETSHDTVGGHGFVVLDEVDGVTQNGGNFLIELPLGETLEEVAAGVTKNFGFDYQKSIYICFNYVHLLSLFEHE